MREPAIAPATEEPGTFGGDMGQRSEPVTLRMIADEAAVNVSTVSRVINFSDKEICRWASGEMIERIRVVVAAPGYLRRPQPHGLRGNR